MPLGEVLGHKEHSKSQWKKASQIPSLDYWFGSQYYGPLGGKLQYDIGLIEDICRQNYLPPIVLGYEKSNPHLPKQNSGLVTIGKLRQTGEEGIPIGWKIDVKGDQLYGLLQKRSLSKGSQLDDLFVKSMDALLKQSFFKVAWFETLDLRLRSNNQMKEMLARGIRQSFAIVIALLATNYINSLSSRIESAIVWNALVQNFIAWGRDVSRPKYFDEETLEFDSRTVAELWRRDHYPERFERERLGPGLGKNLLIRSIPMAEMGEPVYRFIGSANELRRPLIRIS